MAFAISVISISRPNMMNSGTASRMSELMPSSIRPGRTASGVVVVVSRAATVVRPKANAIGTPISTPAPSSSTKKDQQVQVAYRNGRARHKPEPGSDHPEQDGGGQNVSQVVLEQAQHAQRALRLALASGFRCCRDCGGGSPWNDQGTYSVYPRNN